MKYFSKSDVAFSVIIVAIGILLFFILNAGEVGSNVRVTKNGEVIGNMPLNQSATMEINGDYTNILEIKDGMAFISYADCPDKVCTNSKINRQNSAIVCLPNKVSITITGKGEVDAVTQ